MKKLTRKVREDPFPLEEAFWSCLVLGFGIYTMYIGRVTAEVVAGLVVVILLVIFLAVWSYIIVPQAK